MRNSPKGRNLIEYINGLRFHKIWSSFIKTSSIKERKELVKSIDLFKELKPKSHQKLKNAKERSEASIRVKDPFTHSLIRFKPDLKKGSKSLLNKLVE